MECTTTMWLPREVDQVDETMHNHCILLGAGEWKAARGMGLAPMWRSIGMSPSAPPVYIGSGHSGVLHDKALLKGLPLGIPGDKIHRSCPIATVRRRYHLLHPRLIVGGSLLIHHDENLLQFLRSPTD